MVIRTITLLTLLILSLGISEARMFRWVDENGMTVYSQSPPPSGEASEVKIHTFTAAPTKNTAPSTQTGDTAPPLDNGNKSPSEPSREEVAESNRIKARNCAAGKKNLDVYQNLGNRLIKTPDGLYKRLTEAQRQQKIEENKQVIEEFCGK